MSEKAAAAQVCEECGARPGESCAIYAGGDCRDLGRDARGNPLGTSDWHGLVVSIDTFKGLEQVARVLGVASPGEALDVLVKEYLDA